MSDILDTSHEGKKIELSDNRVKLGDDVNILAKDPTLKHISIGVGWDLTSFNADNIDLDVSLFMLDKNGQTRVDDDFVFYNQMETLEGAVRHHGDNRTGAGDGDDESIAIDLQGVPFDVMQLVFTLSIYKGEEKDQNLSMLRNTYIRLVNRDNNIELLRYVLDDDLKGKTETAVVVAVLNREGPKWHFKPIGEFVEGGLGVIARRYGLIVIEQ